MWGKVEGVGKEGGEIANLDMKPSICLNKPFLKVDFILQTWMNVPRVPVDALNYV